jgi:hypothetical protein
MTGQTLKKLQMRNAPVFKPLALASALGMSLAAGCGGAPETEEATDAVGSVKNAATTYVNYNGHTYAFVTDALSWTNAKAACQAIGSGWALATIDNRTEEAYLARFQGAQIWWIGGSQRTDGSWGWETPQDTEGDAARAYFNWNTSQPDNTSPVGGDANCVADDAASGRWGDYACPTSYAYICERRYEGDFNGDGQQDLVMRSSLGENAFWYMNGTTMGPSAMFQPVYDGNSHIVAAVDFNRDRQSDIVWRSDSSGKNGIWFMSSTGSVATFYGLPDETDLAWKIVSAADFDNNGSMDLLWRKQSTGQIRIWYMDYATPTNVARVEYITSPTDTNPDSEIVGTGDFNNDGLADILWRRATDGAMRVWYMNDRVWLGTATLPLEGDLNWKVGGVGAYSGTSPNDIVWYNTATNDVRIWKMRGTTRVSSHFVNKGQNGWWKAMGSR